MIEKRNKKGDIPVTILVLGVFAVCGLALASFYFSGLSVQKDFVGLGIVREVNYVADEIRFYENDEIGKNPPDFMGVFDGISVASGISEIVFSGKKESDVYVLEGFHYENKRKYFLFGELEKKEKFYVEYEFKP